LINVCILGAGGQLGTSLVNKLSENNDTIIYACDKFFSNYLNLNNVNYIEVDFSSKFEHTLSSIPKNDVVFIDCIGIQHSLFAKTIYDINFLLNKKIFEYIKSNFSNFHFIFISSLSVRNDMEIEIAAGVGNEINFYGKSKLDFEQYLKENYASSYNITIFRPAAFYSEKLSDNLNSFFELLINKIFILPRNEKQRSFISLDYFSAFIKDYINKNRYHEVIEIADKAPIEFTNLIDRIKKSNLSVKSKIYYFPTIFFKIIGKLGYLLEKFGLHINILTIIGEFGYSYVSKNNYLSSTVNLEDTYQNFEEIIYKKFTN